MRSLHIYSWTLPIQGANPAPPYHILHIFSPSFPAPAHSWQCCFCCCCCLLSRTDPHPGGDKGDASPTSPNYIHSTVLKLHIHTQILTQCRVKVVKLGSLTQYILHTSIVWNFCSCGSIQTMSHIVDECPLTKFNGGLQALHSADGQAVEWLRKRSAR